MISYKTFEDQIMNLSEVLKDESNYILKTNETEQTKTAAFKRMQTQLITRNGKKFLVIRQMLEDMKGGSVFVNLISISHHNSYQEPVVYFKCGEYVNNDIFVAGQQLIAGNETDDKGNNSWEAFEENSWEAFEENSWEAFDIDDYTEIKYIWNIDTILELGFLQSGTHDSHDIAGNVTLDYHNILMNQPWFFVHPCQTNDMLRLDSGKDEIDYMLSWMSIYGKYFNISLNSKVICQSKKES